MPPSVVRRLLVLIYPTLISAVPSIQAGQIFDWNNTGTDFDVAASWTNENLLGPAGPPGLNDIASFVLPKVTDPIATNTSTQTILGLNFATLGTGYTLSSNPNAILGIGTSGISASNITGTNTITAELLLNFDESITQAAGGTLNITGPVRLGGGIGTTTITIGSTGSNGTIDFSPSSAEIGNDIHFVTNVNATLPATVSETPGAGIIKSGPGTLTLTGVNTYDGATTVRSGELNFAQNGYSNNSAIFLGDTSGSKDAIITVSGDNHEIRSSLTVQAGNTGQMILRSDNPGAVFIPNHWTTPTGFGTAVVMNKDLTIAVVNPNNTVFEVDTIVASATYTLNIGSPAGSTTTVNNAGNVGLLGVGNNTNVGVVVNSGLVSLSKSFFFGGFYAVGTGLTINSGATAELGNNTGNQLADTAFVTINSGGTFKTQGFSEIGPTFDTLFTTPGFGAFTLHGGATLDFDTGGSSALSATTGVVMDSGTISIQHWTGLALMDDLSPTNDRLLFQVDPNFSAAQLGQFQFYDNSGNPIGTGAAEIQVLLGGNEWTELVPSVAGIPEPGTWLGADLMAVFLLLARRRCAWLRFAPPR